jgi:hypothetical protein
MKHVHGCQTKKSFKKSKFTFDWSFIKVFKQDKERSGVDFCNMMTISHEVEQKGTRVLVVQAYSQACPKAKLCTRPQKGKAESGVPGKGGDIKRGLVQR